MKKNFTVIFISLFLLIFFPTSAFAIKDKIIETPNLKVIIDGKIVDVGKPISVNNHTYLKYKSFFVGLGIPDDKNHLNWNKKNNTLTVFDGKKTLTLIAAGDNSEKRTAAPLIYKKDFYVSAGFVSKYLDRKFTYNKELNCLFITSTNNYNKINKILSDANKRFSNTKKLRYKLFCNFDILQEYHTNITTDCYVDLIEKTAYSKEISSSCSTKASQTDKYIYNNYQYSKSENSSTWTKTSPNINDYNKDFFLTINSNNSLLNYGLNRVAGKDPNLIELKGAACINELIDVMFQQVGKPSNKKYVIKNLETTVKINKNTNRIKSIYTDISLDYYIIGKQKLPVYIRTTVIFSDYDGDFIIDIPDEIKNMASK